MTYPKTGSQVLFVGEDQSFGRAYLLQCQRPRDGSHVLRQVLQLDIIANKESLGTLLSELIKAIGSLQVPTPSGLSGMPLKYEPDNTQTVNISSRENFNRRSKCLLISALSATQSMRS